MPLAPSPYRDQAELADRFARFRRHIHPPAVFPPSAAEIARALQGARRAQRWRRLPVVGRMAAAFAHLLRLWSSRELDWRQKMMATPWLGRLAQWGVAFVRLAGFRRQTLGQLAQLSEEVARLNHELRRLGQALAEERASRLAAEAALPARVSAALVQRQRGQALPAEVYRALEDRLRGSSAAIAERCASYLPWVREARRLGLPAADLGCGRGEWLSFLANEGLPAYGVDGNPAMVASCRAKGLAVEEGEALAWLLARPPCSLALISLFHVAEHLRPETLFALLQAAYHALAPGGLLLIETPNPENIQVATYSFWLDPTHRRPLPPPLLTTLVELAGLQPREIVRLAPWPEAATEDDLYPPLLRKLLFCAQDYGLIAEKPKEKP